MVIKQSDSLVERLFPAGKHCSQADRAENGVEKARTAEFARTEIARN